MKADIRKLPKNQVELTIEVSSEELQPYVIQAAADLAREMKIPGFRPGKAPYDVVKQRLGEMKIYQEAAEKAVAVTYGRAVIENKLVTIGSPEISLEKIAPGNPMIFKATVALLPQVTLGDYKKIKADKRAVTVGQKDVDETIINLQRMFGKEKRVQRPARKGDKVEVDFNTYVDKIAIDGGESKNHPVMIGEGNFIPGFEDDLIGISEGQTKEFELKFPKEYHRKDLAGRPVSFRVKAHNVMEIELPPLDDAFAKQVGQFEKFDDLRQQIEANIHEERATKEQQRWEMAIIEEVVKKSSFEEIPEIVIESELHKMLHELEHEVTEQGMKFEDYLSSIKKTREDLEKEFRPRAIKRIQTALVLRAIADQEKITVADHEIHREIENQKKKYHDHAEVMKQIDSEEYHDYLKNVMRSRKVFEWLEKNSAAK
jgi:trigger factor